MKIKYLLYILTLGIGFTACSEGNDLPGEERISNEKVIVHINLQQDLQINAETRATDPMALENANKMYNLYILHYNAEGALITGDTQYKVLATEGELETSWSPRLTAGEGTICLIANLGSGNSPKKWPLFLADLKKTDILTLPIDNTGLFTDKMYMFGYYEGPITSSMSLSVLMGRMAACVNIVLTSEFTYSYTISTKINNAVASTHYFPMENDDDKNGLTYVSFSDTNAGTVNKNSDLTLYYYMGENIAPDSGKRTNIEVTATWSNSSKKYTIELGADAPGTANRNYSIYRNNNYTFNIHLKN